MRDLKFACPHCEQHIKCDDTMTGQSIPCPACGQSVTVPALPDPHHLRITTGRVPIPTHAHSAPRSTDLPTPVTPAPPAPQYSRYAIASLSLAAGSLVLGPFGCISGICFGHLAQAELKRNPGLEGATLARSGLIISYAFLVMFTLLGIWLTLRWVPRHG
jgi:hypothetical protein